MLKLAWNHSNILLSQPESGMGYQIVEATLSDYHKRHCIAYNAELLVYLDELEQIIKYGSYNFLLEKSASSLEKIIDLKVITKSSFLKFASVTESKEADKSPIEYTEEEEVFKRFSAYRNDRRITSNWGLLPGTYATTEDDAEYVETGMDAVARYALPNPQPAIYVFTIEPPEATEIQRGIVQPAHNQPGGGVEIIFTDGSPDDTVSQPYTIPEE